MCTSQNNSSHFLFVQKKEKNHEQKFEKCTKRPSVRREAEKSAQASVIFECKSDSLSRSRADLCASRSFKSVRAGFEDRH